MGLTVRLRFRGSGFVRGLANALLGLGGLILWIVLLMKANQGQMFKLPIIGDMAEKQAGAA